MTPHDNEEQERVAASNSCKQVGALLVSSYRQVRPGNITY